MENEKKVVKMLKTKFKIVKNIKNTLLFFKKKNQKFKNKIEIVIFQIVRQFFSKAREKASRKVKKIKNVLFVNSIA